MLQAHRISVPDVTEQLNSQLFGLAFTHCQHLFTRIVRSVMVYIVTGMVAFSSAIFLYICPFLKVFPHILSFLIFFFFSIFSTSFYYLGFWLHVGVFYLIASFLVVPLRITIYITKFSQSI